MTLTQGEKDRFQFEPASYPRSFGSFARWKLHSVVSGFVLIGLGGLLLGKSDLPLDDWRFAVLAGALVPGFALWVMNMALVFRTKLVLTPDAIELHGPLRVDRILRRDITAYRLHCLAGTRGFLELRHHASKSKSTKFQIFFKPEAEYVAWFSGINKLDDVEQLESIQTIESDDNLGASKDERVRRFRLAMVWARCLGIASLLLSVWALIRPPPYGLVIPLLAAMPWAMYLLVWKFRSALMLKNAWGERIETYAVISILPPATVLLLRTTMDFNLLSWSSLLLPVMCFTAPIAIATFWLFPAIRGRIELLAGTTIALAFYFTGAIPWGNVLIDSAKPSNVYQITILNKHELTGRPAVPYFTVTPWGPFSARNDIVVATPIYSQYQVGDTVCLSLRPGAIGVAWYSNWDVHKC